MAASQFCRPLVGNSSAVLGKARLGTVVGGSAAISGPCSHALVGQSFSLRFSVVIQRSRIGTRDRGQGVGVHGGTEGSKASRQLARTGVILRVRTGAHAERMKQGNEI